MLTGPGVIMQERDERMVSQPATPILSTPQPITFTSHTHTHILSEVKKSESVDLLHQLKSVLFYYNFISI